MDGKINILVVEDSPVVRDLLVHILNSDTNLNVIGTAENGADALEFLRHRKPDIIVTDIHMPVMDGYELTRKVMETQPVPIVVCTASFNPDEVNRTFRALEAGALAIVAKPLGMLHPDYANMAATLVEKIRLMSEIKLVRRVARAPVAAPASPVSPVPVIRSPNSPIRVVAIGTSTGGPPVLQTVLSGLPADFPVPLLIVQHIATGFLPGLAEWLNETTGFPVHIGMHGEEPLPGHAYLAPDGCHMGISPGGRIALSVQDPENGLRPAVSFLFRSVAETCGARAAAVLLTGMGKDGAAELKSLRDLGAVTFAQDAKSSVVHGMPGEAIRIGAACHVLPPEKISVSLRQLAQAYAVKSK